MILNSKSFNLVINKAKTFTLNISGFPFVVSWFQNIRIPYIKMTISVLKLIQRLIITINVKKIKITFINSLIKLHTYATGTISIRKIIITSLMRLIQNTIITIKVPYVAITNIMKQKLRIILFSLKIPKVVITGSFLLGIFNYLSVFDPQYLSDLDNVTLESMDATYS